MLAKIATLDPAVQTVVVHLAHPELSFAALGERFGVTKQAVDKRIRRVMPYLVAFEKAPPPCEHQGLIDAQQREIEQLRALVKRLRLELIIRAAIIFLAKALEERVRSFFPDFKLTRLTAHEKKHVLDLWLKHQAAGGLMRDFAAAVGRSTDTLRRWLEAFQKYGLAGLADKTTRPKNFARRIPLWLRDMLCVLFLRFPQWTTYQYLKYVRNHPGMGHCLSFETIAKMKRTFVGKTEVEKQRQKKLWIFEAGSDIWTVDFTCLLADSRFKLQLLTVTDHNSRFVFEPALFIDTSTDRVVAHLEELFVKYGKPTIIKADNGPEFRLDCRAELESFGVLLMNSPTYYAPYNGAHERMHRELKTFIDDFATHGNLTKLEADIRGHRDDHNHRWPLEVLGNQTPAAIFYSGIDFIPSDVEVVKPYVKDDQLRMKFTGRDGKPCRVALDLPTGTCDVQQSPAQTAAPPP